ncbi:MAG: hypothetical protein ACLFVJ_16320 [Persicimonas sp.]
MIRVLIIGRESVAWSQKLAARAAGQCEVETARLPAAGLRQFEATPPDALVVVDTSSTKRASTLVAAIRERPIGQLIPIITIAPPPADSEAAEVDAWLSPNADIGTLAAALEESLGVELAGDQATGQAASSPGAAGTTASISGATEPRADVNQAGADADGDPQEAPAYFIEEIDDDLDRPRRLDRDAIFSSPSDRNAPQTKDGVDEEALQRKLRAVRHEDYYTILELRRGAEGAVVREAFHRLYRRFDPRELDFELAHHHEDELDEIRDALEDAWAVLGDPKLRQAYLEHTTRK